MSNIPKVNIESISFNDSCYVNYGKKWKAKDLYKFAKEKKYEVFDLPLAGINLNQCPFDIECLDDFIYHANRLKNVDLNYPIIIDKYGCIADGYHRVCKAILEGYKTIKAIRLEEMPKKCKIIKEK